MGACKHPTRNVPQHIGNKNVAAFHVRHYKDMPLRPNGLYSEMFELRVAVRRYSATPTGLKGDFISNHSSMTVLHT